MKSTNLLPDRHPIKDFFIADIFDSLPVKNDRHTMEHPFFTLSTKPDVRTVLFEKDNISIKMTPHSEYGLPTMFDKDILLYCGSLIVDQLNKLEFEIEREAEHATQLERINMQQDLSEEARTQYLEEFKEMQKAELRAHNPVPRTIRFSAHDLMVTTNRMTNGQAYAQLKRAFERLKGVSITTNIQTDKKKISSGFGLIESWTIVEASHDKRRMVRLEATLSQWFYNSLVGREVLTINREYFRLRKPLERRLYEIARKFCGYQQEAKIGLDKLHKITGSQSPLKYFRYQIRQIIEDDHKARHFPDYNIALNDNDVVIFSKKGRGVQQQPSLPFVDHSQLQDFKAETIKKARSIVYDAGTGWDFDVIVKQFADFMEIKGNPDDINGAFIGFVKKKVATAP